MGWYGTDRRLAVRSLAKAAEKEILHWDTADVYGDGQAEVLIGQMWGDVDRERVFLASKVGWVRGDRGHSYHPEQIRRQLETTLSNLATDRLDLYYLHHCDFGPNDEYLAGAIECLERFREEGKIRFIGLSDWKSEKIVRYASKVDPDVVQCYRNVVDDSYEASGLKDWVEQNDAGVVFFSPLKHGLLLGLFEGPVTFGEGDHRNSLPDFRDLGLLTRLRRCRHELSARFTDHPQPVLHGLLGALLADAPTGSVIVGLHRPEQVQEASMVGARLTMEDARWIRQLYRENGRPTQASWKSYQETSP